MNNRASVVRDHQVRTTELVVFFIATLAASATYVIFSGPFIEGGAGSAAATVWYREKALVIIWAPMTCAITAAFLFRRKAGLALIASRFDPRRIRPGWWAIALLMPICMHLVPVILSGGISERTPVEILTVWGKAFLFISVIMIGEELGWRGYALPALQARMNPFMATLVLGGLWSLWHYPVWFGIGYGTDGSVSTGITILLLNTVGITALAFIFTWLANNTGACIPLAMLYHGSNNATLRVYGSEDATVPFLASTAIAVLVAVVIVFANRRMFFRSPS